MVTRDPVPEVQFRDEEADTRIVLYARLARRNGSVMHSYSGAPVRAKRARSVEPWVRKSGKLSILESLVMT